MGLGPADRSQKRSKDTHPSFAPAEELFDSIGLDLEVRRFEVRDALVGEPTTN